MKIKNKIKLIVTDIDGTLLNDNKELPDGFFDIIDELNSAGIMFYTASGRNFYSQYKLFGDKADSINYICDNGGYISEGRNLIFHSPIEKSAWQDAILYARELCPEAHPVLCGLKGAYTEEYRNDKLMKDELETVYTGNVIVDDILSVNDDVFKFSLCLPHGAHTVLTPLLSSYDKNGIIMQETADSFMDVMYRKNTKGTGIEYVRNRYGILPEETMIFLDYFNDISMIHPDSITYAMENAPEEIKRMCTHEAPSNNEGGVICAIKEYLKN